MSDIASALTDVMETNGYYDTRKRMDEVYRKFDVNTIGNEVLRMAEPCPVCGREPTANDVNNVAASGEETALPYVVCPNDCVEHLPEAPNTWTFETDGWQYHEHMPEVERRAAGYLGDHLMDIGGPLLNDDICQAAYTEEERAEIRQHVEALCRLVGYNADAGEADRSLSPFFEDDE